MEPSDLDPGKRDHSEEIMTPTVNVEAGNNGRHRLGAPPQTAQIPPAAVNALQHFSRELLEPLAATAQTCDYFLNRVLSSNCFMGSTSDEIFRRLGFLPRRNVCSLVP